MLCGFGGGGGGVRFLFFSPHGGKKGGGGGGGGGGGRNYCGVGAEDFCRIDSLTRFRVLFQHSRRRDNNLGFVMIRPVVLKQRSYAES